VAWYDAHPARRVVDQEWQQLTERILAAWQASQPQ
jgi:hypothetical protein